MADRSPATALTAAQFREFYEAVHRHRPFPWQTDLVHRVLDENRWPDLIDVPTGLGKTSMLDIAVFVTAASSGAPGAGRVGRRRIFFVVDRRIVVDEATTHARRIAAAVQSAQDGGDPGVVGQVAAGLRACAPGGPRNALLPVTTMRGGTTWSAAWLDRPDRPGIVLGTVDQVGSRLLFRGYGVSDRRRPIDAALVGTDALVLVDEAHLAHTLLKTVAAAHHRDRLGVPVPAPAVVRLSATDRTTEGQVAFALDVEAHLGDDLARRRLTAGKKLTLREATARTCAGELAGQALDRIDDLRTPAGQAPVVAVVCNTVDRARAVHTELGKQIARRGAEVDCELLIGRSRPIDRTGLQERILDRFGTEHRPTTRPAVLVATQTVEVGVNLDVDGFVTESASWDALVQRFGRLNRLGTFSDRFPSHRDAAAVVVHDGKDDGPVYGAARDRTWSALSSAVRDAGTGGLDVGPLACRALSRSVLAGPTFTRRPDDVPVLLAPTLDAWVQTGPVPMVDPPIEPFLHGFDSGAAAVQVLWRDGLLADDPVDTLWDDDPWNDEPAELAGPRTDALLTQWPPRTSEIVEVPFRVVRQWIDGQVPEPVADVDSAPDDDVRTPPDRDPFRVLAQRPDNGSRYRDADTPTTWQWITGDQLRPGDVVVVPSERGGLDEFGWSPADRSPVHDASEAATFERSRSRREAALRIDRQLPTRLGIDGPAQTLVGEGLAALLVDRDAFADPDEPANSDEVGPLSGVLRARLPEQPARRWGWTDTTWTTLHRWLDSGKLRIVDVTDPTDALIAGRPPRRWARLLVGPLPDDSAAAPGRADSSVDRDDEEVAASSIGGTRVTLDQHHAAVRERASAIAEALHLPPELREVVADAAGWHDLGKVEQRFQVMLHGGDATEAAIATEPLAKSGMDQADRLSWRAAARASRLPAGARHEAWSAALVEEYLRTARPDYPGDVDLLIHLVASHHGHARPFARLVLDTEPRPIDATVGDIPVRVSSADTVSLEHPSRFTQLNQRYGRWGLALLETVVRCADTTVSEEGS